MLYTDIAGAPPRFWTFAFATWMDALVAARLKECPIVRTTAGYIDYNAAGNSSGGSGNGTIGTPWLCVTPAEVDTLIRAKQALGYDHFYIKRGAKFYATNAGTGLVVDTNISVSAYGSGANPEISGFKAPYGAGGWTDEGGSPKLYSRAETDAVNWFREDADPDHATRRLTTAAGLAGLRAVPGAWIYDAANALGLGANRLIVSPRVANAAPLSTSQVARGSGNGVLLSAHGARVDSLRVDGWGMASGDTQKYGIQSNVTGQSSIVVTNCVGYYNGKTHVAGHLVGVIDGGNSTWVNNTFGLTIHGGGSSTMLNFYNNTGGGEFVAINNWISHGALKDETYSNASLGQAIYHHTGGTGNPIGLVLIRGTRGPKVGCLNGIEAGTCGANMAHPSSRDDWASIRCFYVDEVYPEINLVSGGQDVILGDWARINPQQHYRVTGAMAVGAPQLGAPTGGACFMINPTISIDLFACTAAANNYFGFYNRVGGTLPTTHWNARYVAMCPANQNFVEDMAQANTDLSINSVYVPIGSAADFRMNLLCANQAPGASASGMSGCIFCNSPETGSYGSTQNPTIVGSAALLGPVSRGSPASMVSALGSHPLGWQLEYDNAWRPRLAGSASAAGPVSLDMAAVVGSAGGRRAAWLGRK